MKTLLPAGSALRRACGTLILIAAVHSAVFSQATAPLKFGNSYVNLSKRTVGGPVEPGDTLEIRTNFYVNSNYNGGTGLLYSARYFDNLPTHTSIIDSLRMITNEGLTNRVYTLAANDDAGSYIATPAGAGDYQLRINMGGAGGINPGPTGGPDPMTLSDTTGAGTLKAGASKPLFSAGSIFCTAFRVVVTGNYGDTVTLGAGKIVYRFNSSASDTMLNATQYQILIAKPSTLCTSSTSTNFAAESGGTFGHGAGLDRSSGPTFPIPNYIYLPVSGTTTSINDGYYAIVNNTSPTSSTFPGAAYQPNCGSASGVNDCANREFGGFWFIGGDHTGTSTAAGNAPPNSSTDAGYMLLVNADLATSEAYHQVINGLCPNTYYQFSAWVKNVCPNCGIDSNGTATYRPGVLPNLTLVVDGIDRIATGQMDTVGWQQRGFVLLTGPSQTSITISIRNNAPGGGGNDWALDDISLATCPPDLLLTPNKPDTLCQGADDTVRFKISSFVNNYTQWMLQQSTDNGANWAAAGLDTLGRPASGTVIPFQDPATGLYIDTVTRYYRIAATDNTIIYRIIVASTVANLTTNGCFYTTAQPKIVRAVNCMIVLPTTLLSFTGQVSNGLGNLQWTTADEVPGLLYTVERSDDGVHFAPIATLPAVAGGTTGGGSGGGASYRYTDANPVGPQTYYRILMTSASINRYSNLVLLSYSTIAFEVRSVLNPFTDHLTINLTTPGYGYATICLIDMYGRYLRREKQPVIQGLNELNVYGLGGLPAGTYAVQIQYGDQMISRKVVKVNN